MAGRGSAQAIVKLSGNQGALKLTFVRESGVITALRVDQGGGHYVLARTGG